MSQEAHTDAHADNAGHDIGFHAPHAVDTIVFVRVLVALLILTVLTVAVSYVDFGSGNMFVAMLIASVKVSLVMAYFMHLKWDTPINNLAIISSFLFLSLLFIFTLADYGTRKATDPILIEVPDNVEALKAARRAKLGN